MKTDATQRSHLLQVARTSLEHGIRHGSALPVDITRLAPALKAIRATFVTLNVNESLRGCMGTIEPIRPLAWDISENAFSAAFRDPRFRPVTEPEMSSLTIDVSILSPMQPVICEDDAELLLKLQPGIDGLLIDDGHHRATFLPKVWDNLPDRGDFLRQLKLKAGFTADYWNRDIRVFRYRTENFSETG